MAAVRSKDKNDHVSANTRRARGWKDRMTEAVNEALDRTGMSVRALAARALDDHGRPLAHTTVLSALQGEGTMRISTMISICDALGIDVVRVLLGGEYARCEVPDGKRIGLDGELRLLPVVPLAAAHEGLDAIGDVILPENVVAAPKWALLALRLNDDSMKPTYLKGDVLFVRKSEPKNGDIVVAIVDGQQSCSLRRYKLRDLRVELSADNEDYGTQRLAVGKVLTIGVVGGFMRA